MKKILFFLILFIIVVLLGSLSLTISQEIKEEDVVTEEDIAREKQIYLSLCEEIGYNPTEEEINKIVEDYKAVQISIAKSNAEGMEFKKAFKTSLLIGCSIVAVVVLLFILTKIRRDYRHELFISSIGRDYTNKKRS